MDSTFITNYKNIIIYELITKAELDATFMTDYKNIIIYKRIIKVELDATFITDHKNIIIYKRIIYERIIKVESNYKSLVYNHIVITK